MIFARLEIFFTQQFELGEAEKNVFGFFLLYTLKQSPPRFSLFLILI
jgi:hypothetical protein